MAHRSGSEWRPACGAPPPPLVWATAAEGCHGGRRRCCLPAKPLLATYRPPPTPRRSPHGYRWRAAQSNSLGNRSPPVGLVTKVSPRTAVAAETTTAGSAMAATRLAARALDGGGAIVCQTPHRERQTPRQCGQRGRGGGWPLAPPKDPPRVGDRCRHVHGAATWQSAEWTLYPRLWCTRPSPRAPSPAKGSTCARQTGLCDRHKARERVYLLARRRATFVGKTVPETCV